MNLTVNNIPTSLYGATLLSAEYGYNKVTNYNDWLRGAKNPLFFGQDKTYTDARFKFLVEAANLNDLDKNCSNLYNAMSVSIVREDNSDWSIEGHVTNIDETNRISPLAREIEISFEGVKVADRELLTHVMSFGSSWVFEAKGNQTVPCHIEIVPDMGYAEMKLTLNDKLFKINTIGSDSMLLIIDSEKGIVTLDGDNKIEDYESWELPYLQGGLNTLSINGAPTVKISYNGRWM